MNGVNNRKGKRERENGKKKTKRERKRNENRKTTTQKQTNKRRKEESKKGKKKLEFIQKIKQHDSVCWHALDLLLFLCCRVLFCFPDRVSVWVDVEVWVRVGKKTKREQEREIAASTHMVYFIFFFFVCLSSLA